MQNKKNIIIAFGILVLVVAFSFLASAHDGENFELAKGIISQNIPCSELNNSQLEMIGDYYMEQVNPGEMHEYMDQMMGGDGSEPLRNAHISMAYRFYCNPITQNSGYGGMMGSSNYNYGGMMNLNYPYKVRGYSWTTLLLDALIIVLIILTIVLTVKFSRNSKRNSRRSKK